jgi:hypothetical protein
MRTTGRNSEKEGEDLRERTGAAPPIPPGTVTGYFAFSPRPFLVFGALPFAATHPASSSVSVRHFSGVDAIVTVRFTILSFAENCK